MTHLTNVVLLAAIFTASILIVVCLAATMKNGGCPRTRLWKQSTLTESLARFGQTRQEDRRHAFENREGGGDRRESILRAFRREPSSDRSDLARNDAGILLAH